MASKTPSTVSGSDLPPADTEFTPAAELSDAGVEFQAETAEPASRGALFGGVSQTLKDEAGKLTASGLDKAKAYAVDGKDRAGGALDEFAKLMTDAASTVDDRLGAQYGDYARSAANSLTGFADTLRNKDIDELLGDARELVKKSPAVAIGTAAAIGFVLARLVKSGLDANDSNTNNRA